MAERPVVNASPLIFLARGGFLDFLQLAGEQIVVPAPVADEIGRRGVSDPAAAALAQTSWLPVVTPASISPVVAVWDLGPGESSVLSWALAHPGTEAIIDDLAARRCAAALGIPVRGTLGLVLTAKKRGIIPQAGPVIEQLREAGMYLSDRVLKQALTLVCE